VDQIGERIAGSVGAGPLDALVVLGSGMSGTFAEGELETVGALATTVDGHQGVLAMLRADRPLRVLVSLGRRHLYEGITVAEAQRTVREASALGARTLVLANAAGGVHPGLRAGDLMLITDVLTSLLGPQGRFVPSAGHAVPGSARPGLRLATHLYRSIEEEALARGVRLASGIYAGLLGPCYETRAEVRMLRRLGASAVGMSTVVEAAAGADCGMEIIGLSLITNVHREVRAGRLDHAEVVGQGRSREGALRAALDAILEVVARGRSAPSGEAA
jgi:purine-nucleoside phosphorylase